MYYRGVVVFKYENAFNSYMRLVFFFFFLFSVIFPTAGGGGVIRLRTKICQLKTYYCKRFVIEVDTSTYNNNNIHV